MEIAIIVAVDENNVIGNNGELPWKLTADLKRFKKLTERTTVVMGRKTFESIGKPLPNRHNMVFSRNTDFKPDGVEVINDIDRFLAGLGIDDVVFIIGGAQIYEMFMCVTDKIYLTRVHTKTEGDTKFEFDPGDKWELMEDISYPQDDLNEYAYSFLTYERRSNYGSK